MKTSFRTSFWIIAGAFMLFESPQLQAQLPATRAAKGATTPTVASGNPNAFRSTLPARHPHRGMKAGAVNPAVNPGMYPGMTQPGNIGLPYGTNSAYPNQGMYPGAYQGMYPNQGMYYPGANQGFFPGF